MGRLLVVVCAVGCGRIGFDPTGPGTDGGSNTPPAGFGPAATNCDSAATTGPTVHVAPIGNDVTGDGSLAAPWRTIQMTYDRVAPDTTILVAPGQYNETLSLTRTVSPQRITIRADTPYTVVIAAAPVVVNCNACTGLVLDGLYIHTSSAGGLPVLHLNSGEDVLIRNCIVDNLGTSATLRASGDPRNVTIQRTALVDGHPPLHLANTNGTTIEDNLIIETVNEGNNAMLWLEDPTSGADVFRRNILAGFQGCNTCGMMQLRGSIATRVESNLVIAGPAPSIGAFHLEGATNTLLQFNTVAGHVTGNAEAITAVSYNALQVTGLQLLNSVFFDPTGMLADFSDGTATDVAAPTLRSNAYWNAGSAIGTTMNDVIVPSLDPQPVLGDPQLPIASFTPITWNATTGAFSDGSRSVCEAFHHLALQYGMPPVTSPIVGAATGADRPADLLGYARDLSTLGALEPH
jgi:hypothetical protein